MENLISIFAAVGCIVAGIIIWIVILMILYSGQPDKNADVTKNSELCAIMHLYSYDTLYYDKGVIVARSKEEAEQLLKNKYSEVTPYWDDDFAKHLHEHDACYMHDEGEIEHSKLYITVPW